MHSMHSMLNAARARRTSPQDPGDPPSRHVKNNVFPSILEGFGRKPSNYKRPGPWRQLASVGASWRRLVRATHKIHYFLVLPGGASAGCRGPPLSGGNPQLTSAQDRGASWRSLASPTNDPRLMQNAAKGPHIVAGRRKTTQNRCRTQQNDITLMQHAHALENEVLL